VLEEIVCASGCTTPQRSLRAREQRGGDRPRGRVIAAEHDRRDARVDREDEIERRSSIESGETGSGSFTPDDRRSRRRDL